MKITHQAIVPPGNENDISMYQMSPAVISGDLVYVSGQLGIQEDGVVPSDPGIQAEVALAHVGRILKEAGCDYCNVMSLNTFIVGSVGESNKWFLPAKVKVFTAPFPVWTSVGVTNLAHPECVIEISVIARIPT